MNQQRASENVEIPGDLLSDSAAMGAQMLRSLAEQWRFRLRAGRQAQSSTARILRFVKKLEAAAQAIERSDTLRDLEEVEAERAGDRPRDDLLLDEGGPRYRLLVESVRDYAIFMLDREGRIASWNPGAERINGYLAEEAIGRHVSMLYPPEAIDVGRPERELGLAASEGRYEEEGWRVRKDGTRYWVHATMTAVRDPQGRLCGYAKVTQDITRLHETMEALRRSEAHFRLLVEGARDYAIFMLDPDGQVTSWNSGAEHLSGYRADEMIGRHISLMHDERDREQPIHQLARACADGIYREEAWRVRKDGSRFWASITITALRDAGGVCFGFAKVMRDMTDARMAEEALRRANAELEERVRQRTAEITAANQELEAFSYSVSHDLRTPLRALDGFSKLLLEEAGHKLDEQERDYLLRISTASQRMSQLTDALLMLSRLTRAPIARHGVDVSSLAGSIVAELRHADPERQVEVVIADDLRAHADPHLLRTALQNLLQNAWKFTRKQPHARIEIGCTERDGERVYHVRDNGAGFDMAHAGRLFMPFQRLHRVADYEGTGIGLATVQRIVQRHGGRIWAESRPGLGASFQFTLGGTSGA